MSDLIADTCHNDSVWENYKEIIRALYLVEDRTLKDVKINMESTYGFHATKSQYEIQFKDWDFRKYCTKDEWSVIVPKLQKRKRDNKDSEVCILGALMKSKKVKKAISRYGSVSLHFRRSPSPRTPEGILIRTPPLVHASLSTGRTSPVPLSFTAMAAGYEPAQLQFLPFMQFNAVAGIGANFPPSIFHSDISSSISKVHDFSTSVLAHFGKGVNKSDLSKASASSIQAFMPESMFSSHDPNLQTTLSQKCPTTIAHFLKMTLYMLSNNIMQPDSDLGKHVYDWIKFHSDMRLLDYLLSNQGPTAEALAEQLFILAIENGDIRMIKKLLQSSLHLEMSECTAREYRGRPPLYLACELGNLELVQVLLDAGAHVNEGHCEDCLTLAINGRPPFSKGSDRINLELIYVLLDAGADVNPLLGSPLVDAAATCNVTLVSILLSEGASPNHTGGGEETALLATMSSSGNTPDVISIVRELLQAGADPCCTTHIQKADFDSWLHDDDVDEDRDEDVDEDGDGNVNVERKYYEEVIALRLSLRYHSIELTQMLLGAGAQITESAFITAVKMEQLGIIKLLLDSGAQISKEVIKSAASNIKYEVVLLLLDKANNDVREIGENYLLIAAIRHGKKDMAEKLPLSGLMAGRELKKAIKALVDRDDIPMLRLLLHRGPIFLRNYLVNYTLSLAISKGRSDMTEVLLAAGRFPLTRRCTTNSNPLLSAIRQRDADLSRRLLTAGAAVNMTIAVDETPYLATVLPAAIAWSQCPLIQDIIDRGADINAPECKGGRTSLTVAVERNDLVTVQFLIGAGANVNSFEASLSGHTALTAAVRNDDICMVRYLLGYGADPDEGSLIAAVSRSLEIMETLLGARLNRYRLVSPGFGSRALQNAVLSSNADMIKLLLSYGVDPNAIVRPYHGQSSHLARTPFEESAFGTALRSDESEKSWIIKLFLNHSGTDVNKIVCQDERNILGYRDETTLLSAIHWKRAGLVQLLICAGASVNPGPIGIFARTPLQLAVEKGELELTKMLLENGADVNAAPFEEYGATALQFAAVHGFLSIVLMLMEKGADVNASPAKKGGRTALEGACEQGRIDILQVLLNAGALTRGLGSKQFERAREFASENGHLAARRLVETFHAQHMDDSITGGMPEESVENTVDLPTTGVNDIWDLSTMETGESVNLPTVNTGEKGDLPAMETGKISNLSTLKVSEDGEPLTIDGENNWEDWLVTDNESNRDMPTMDIGNILDLPTIETENFWGELPTVDTENTGDLPTTDIGNFEDLSTADFGLS